MGNTVTVIPGERFSKLVVLKEVFREGKGRWVLCKCDCGNEKIVSLSNLRQGNVKSCRCLLHNATTKTHGGKGTRLYRIWAGIKSRCNNPHVQEYPRYGGRGITLCKEWLDFDVFREWSNNNGYSDDLTIERIDVNGNYSPENCKWITLADQSRNRRNTIYVTYNNQEKTLKQWSKDTGIKYSVLFSRLKYLGWATEKAFTEPVQIHNRERG